MISFDEADLVHDVLAAGDLGYLLKNIPADELVKAIRDAASGKSILSPEAARVLTDDMVTTLATEKAHFSNFLEKLQGSSRSEAIAYAIKNRIVSL
jgi:DNA-binding NarL/FixJ family response regulator